MKKGIGHFILELILGALVIVLMSYLFSGSVYVKNFTVAILVALVLTLLNTFIKPILTIISFPITLMTMGIFQLVINGFLLTLVTDILKPDFFIDGFGMTMVVSVCISILYSLLGIGD